MVLHPPSGTAFDVGHLLVVDAASLAFAGKATESQQSVIRTSEFTTRILGWPR